MLVGSAFLVPAAKSLAQGEIQEISLDDLLKQPIISEPQFGDPLGPNDKFETLSLVRPDQQKAVGNDPVFPKKDAKELGHRMLQITAQFADSGVARNHNASQVVEFLRVVDFENIVTPFCAAGVSYAACRAYCDLKTSEPYDSSITPKRLAQFKSKLTTINAHYFFPSASVRVIKAAAIKKGNWVRRGFVPPEPGWPVVFSWDGSSAGNHIGLVEMVHNEENAISTLEYNTSVVIHGNERDGGHVARKKRPLDAHVLGYINIFA
jgi:hypothetical protein